MALLGSAKNKRIGPGADDPTHGSVIRRNSKLDKRKHAKEDPDSLELLNSFIQSRTCATFPGAMYQIVFNEISAAEMAKIPKKLQLELLAEFQFLPENLDHLDSKAFGVIEREGKKLYRYRASDYRIYFARTAEGILVHRVLHKNTIGDFLFRSKLPLAEDEQLEQSTGFWQLIEEGERRNAAGEHRGRERT
jgi:mRNA-degrading endonuclease RelE of RelBE toxin-antitoxin system